MTIKNYTFLSQNGTEFPISATADRRLYLMLGGMDYSTFKMIHWKPTTNTALNRVYTDTSLVVGGAYFELNNQSITLTANAINFVHINIDLSNVANPVSLSVETKDNSNNVDMNTTSSVLKKCIEIATTSATEILTVTEQQQETKLKKVSADSVTTPISTAVVDLGWGLSVALIKKNGMVFANGTTTPASNVGTSGGANVGVRVPEGFRPLSGKETTIKLQGNNGQWGSYVVTSDGNIKLVTGGMNVGYTFHVSGAWIVE